MHLILASASPRRRQLLQELGLDFEVQPSSYAEDLTAETPEKTALLHAIMKARDVAQIFRRKIKELFYTHDFPAEKSPITSATEHEPAAPKSQTTTFVLGVDTIGEYQGQILGKPRDLEHAREMVTLLSGSTHNVISGLCLINTATNQEFPTTVTTQVTFATMTRAEIEQYLATNEWHDKAAAYGIQGYGSLFVKEIKGDYFNVVGLPLNALYQLFKRAGVKMPF